MNSVIDDTNEKKMYQRPSILHKSDDVLMNNYINICKQNLVQTNKTFSKCLISKEVGPWDFSHDVLSVKGFKAMCESVKQAQIIHYAKSLNLRYNNLENCSIQLLCETFMNASQLELLDLSGNCFGKKIVGLLAQLVQSCDKLKTLKLEGMVQLDEANIIYLKKAKQGLEVIW